MTEQRPRREVRGQAFEDWGGIQARGMASPKHSLRPGVEPGAAGTVIEGVSNEVPHFVFLMINI